MTYYGSFRKTINFRDRRNKKYNKKYTSFPKFKGILQVLFANLTFANQHFYLFCVGLTFANKLILRVKVLQKIDENCDNRETCQTFALKSDTYSWNSKISLNIT